MAAILELLTIGPHAELWNTVASSLVFFPVDLVDAEIAKLPAFAGVDVIKFMITLLLALPLGAMARFVPLGAPRHFYNFFIGMCFAQMCYGTGWLHLFFSSGVAYLIMMLLPRSKSHLLVFGWMMLYMGLMHVYRMWSDWLGWKMDFSGPQMMATIKITSMAFNYSDGRASEGFKNDTERKAKVDQLKAELGTIANALTTEKDAAAAKALKKKKISLSGQKLRANLALVSLPSPLEFFGWVHNFSTYQAGPAIEIQEYLKVNNTHSKTGGCLLASLKQFVLGAIFLAVHLMLAASYPIGDKAAGAAAKAGILSADLRSQGLHERLIFAWLSGLGVQSSYFMAWLWGESAANAFGYGYTGEKDGKPQWNGCQNIDIKGWIFGQNMSTCSKAWNQKTQAWLQTYIYFRVPFGRFGCVMSTYAVSAYWHGFYPGYYLTFFTLGYLSTIQDKIIVHLRPWFLASDGSATGGLKKFYDACCIPGLHWAKTFAALPFMMSTAQNAWLIQDALGYLGIATLLVGAFVVPMIPIRKFDDAAKKQK